MTPIDLQHADALLWPVIRAVLRDWWLEHFEFVLSEADPFRLEQIETCLRTLPLGSARDGALNELPFSAFSSEFYEPGATQSVPITGLSPITLALFRREPLGQAITAEICVWPGDAFPGMHEDEIAQRAGAGTLPMPAVLPDVLRFVRALQHAGGFKHCHIRLEGEPTESD